MELDEFFTGRDTARQIFEAVCRTIESIGPAEIRISKSSNRVQTAEGVRMGLDA